MTGGQVCAVTSCKSASRKGKMSFFAFPKNADRARRWAMLCGRADLVEQAEILHERVSIKICSGHFERHHFLNDLKNRLKPDATPSIFPSFEGSSGSSFDHTYGVFTLPLLEVNKEPKAPKVPKVELSTDEETVCVQEFIPSKKIKILQNIQLHADPLQELDFNIPLVSPPLVSPTSTQTSFSLSSHTPRKEKLRKSVKELRSEVAYLKKQVASMTNIVDNATFEHYKALTHKFVPNKDLANFILVQASQNQKHPKGRRYSIEFKEKCLQMYLMGPKLYKKLLVKVFCLPGPRTLQKHLHHIQLFPGINNILLDMLKVKVQHFKKEDRICIICVDEMLIKPNLFYHIGNDEVVGFEDFGGKKTFNAAKHATVVMARGIRSNWKQPLSYYFHHSTCPGSTLKELVHTVIENVQKIGLKVCALVSDMGSNNLQMAESLNVTCEKPYFVVNEEKIIYMFDTPHLLKATRNNLLKYKFSANGQQACWQHIQQFYVHDKQYNCRAAPKLTDSHICPTNFEKMKVKYAAQVFSATVAASLNLYVRFGQIPAEASATATLISMLDNLFDLCNSSSTHQGKHFNRAYKGLDFQVELLAEVYNYFDILKLLNSKDEDVTKKVKFIKCWKITIKGIMHLWEMLRDEQKLEFLFTRRLNQDCLENFFGIIRQQNGNCINPTPIQFQRTFKKLCCINLMHSGAENCEADSDTMLLKLTDLQFSDATTTTVTLPVHLEPLDTDFHSVDIIEQNVIRYISGYLIKKSLGIHTCSTCAEYARNSTELDDSAMLCFFRAYENAERDTFGNLCMPHNSFVNYIIELEEVFKGCFEECVVEKNVRNHFLDKYNSVKYVHPCENFPYRYIVNLFFRMRLFFTLKFINRILRNARGEREKKRQMIIWRQE